MSHQCLLSLYIFQSFGTTLQCRWLKDGYSYFNDDNDATIAQFNTGTANGRSRKKLFITIFFICIAWILDFKKSCWNRTADDVLTDCETKQGETRFGS
jgi:hypothetical protein